MWTSDSPYRKLLSNHSTTFTLICYTYAFCDQKMYYRHSIYKGLNISTICKANFKLTQYSIIMNLSFNAFW